MLSLSELIIDPRSVGKKLFLVAVKPVYDYKDGHRVSDEPVGYKYEVALPEKHMEKISVRIGGACQIEEPESFLEVVLEGLQLSLYWTPSGHQIKATASKIRPAAVK
nr:hypothetical protein [uncultured Ruminococcus sp.]